MTGQLASLREEYARLAPDSAEGRAVAFRIYRLIRRMAIDRGQP